jgi:hypothetical protein
LKDAIAAVELRVRACGKRRRRMMLWWAEPRRHAASRERMGVVRGRVFFFFCISGLAVVKVVVCLVCKGYFGQSNDVEAKCLYQLQTNSKDTVS